MTIFEDLLLIWVAISNGMLLAGLIAINATCEAILTELMKDKPRDYIYRQ